MEHQVRRRVDRASVPARAWAAPGRTATLWLALTVAVALAAVLMAAIPAPVTASTAGPRIAGTGTDAPGPGGYEWANPGNITADDTSYATCTLPHGGLFGYYRSHYLQGTNFGFDLPSGSSIKGITATIARMSSGGGSNTRDDVVRLIKGGSVAGNDKAVNVNWPDMVIQEASYGGASDLWGLAWTAEDINASNFGLALAVRNASWLYSYTGYVDYMRVTVTYTLPGTTTTVTTSGTPSTYGDSVTFTATVTRAAGTNTPSGTVYFVDGGTTVGSGTLSGSGPEATATYSTTSLTAGSHSMTVIYGGDSNFGGSISSPLVQAVNPKPLTITADNRSKTYGDTVSFAGTELTAAGLVGSDSVSSATLTSPGAPAAAPVTGSPYSIVPSAAIGSGLDNYAISYVEGSLTVNKKALTITASDRAKTQGETVIFAGTEFTAVGLVNSDSVSIVTLSSPGAEASAPDGDYPIIPTFATGSGLANYSITFVNGTLTVSAYGLTITANSTSKTYGDTVTFSGNEFTVSGLLGGDSVDNVTLTSGGAAAGGQAGFWAIIPSAATGTGLGKYTIVYASGILTVSPRALTVTADNATKTYGDTLALAGTEFTVSGLVNSDNVTSISLTSAGTMASASTGPWTIAAAAAAGSGLDNYSIAYIDGSLTVNPRPLTVTADNATKVYGDALAFTGTEFTAAGLVNTDGVTGVILGSTGADALAPVGTYAITGVVASGTGLDNYSISYVDGSLAVTPRDLVITANSRTKAYGQALAFAGTEFTVAGLANSDTVASVTLTSAGAEGPAPVGDYAITTSAALGDGLGNYNITYVDGSLMVRKGVVITASSSSKIYGDTAIFTGTEFSVTGLEGGDTVTSVTLTCAGSEATAAAGPWEITIGNAQGNGLDHYDVTYVNGTLTVNPRPLCITASDASKASGSTATLTGTEFTTSGLVNGDRVILVTLTSDGAEAAAAGGTYDIVPADAIGQGLSNYTITYVNGTLTVTRTAVVWSVTSAPAQTTEGQPVTLTAIIKPTIVWSMTPPSVSSIPEGEEPLVYDIQLTPSGAVGTLTFNYLGVMMTATVNYTKATGTVTFMDGGTVLGTARLVNGTATFTTSDLPPGSHYITAIYGGDGNFEGATTLAHVHSVQPGPGPNWWLIGGSAGGALLLALSLLLLFFLLRRRRRAAGASMTPAR